MEPPQSLDLSQFPNIVPTSPEEQQIEVERRSKALTSIKDIMDNLIKVMQSYVSDLQGLDSQARILEQQKAELIELDKQVRFAHHELETKEAGVDEQLKYIETENKAILEKQLSATAEKEDQVKEIAEATKELENKQKLVDGKLAQLPEIEAKLKELEDKQTALDQLIAADRERKVLLDAREQKILEREARVERLDRDSSLGQ